MSAQHLRDQTSYCGWLWLGYNPYSFHYHCNLNLKLIFFNIATRGIYVSKYFLFIITIDDEFYDMLLLWEIYFATLSKKCYPEIHLCYDMLFSLQLKKIMVGWYHFKILLESLEKNLLGFKKLMDTFWLYSFVTFWYTSFKIYRLNPVIIYLSLFDITIWWKLSCKKKGSSSLISIASKSTIDVYRYSFYHFFVSFICSTFRDVNISLFNCTISLLIRITYQF